jgi:hypothetical protein
MKYVNCTIVYTALGYFTALLLTLIYDFSLHCDIFTALLIFLTSLCFYIILTDSVHKRNLQPESLAEKD